MSNLISFKPSPLAPFVGKWLLDPLSVSRNKVVRLMLRPEGLKKLWACGSIEERAQLLESDPELANRYQSILGFARTGHLTITLQSLTWTWSANASTPGKTTVCPVMRVAGEARKVVVHSVDTRPGASGQPIGYELRMSKRWLLASERYTGRNAVGFPKSPVFRYSLVSPVSGS